MQSPIDYEMLKIYEIKFWVICPQSGRLADNRGGIVWRPAEEDLCFQNSGTRDSTGFAATVNLLGICWMAAEEKNLWQHDQVKQNILRFRLNKMFILLSNIPYYQLWLWLPAPSSGGSALATQFHPEEKAANLVLSNQQLAAYLTRTAPWGKVPLGDKQSLPFWETNWLWKSSVCRARLQGKIEREARMGHRREKGIKMEGENDGKEEWLGREVKQRGKRENKTLFTQT